MGSCVDGGVSGRQVWGVLALAEMEGGARQAP